MVYGSGHDVGAKHHAGTAASRVIIYLPVTANAEVAQRGGF